MAIKKKTHKRRAQKRTYKRGGKRKNANVQRTIATLGEGFPKAIKCVHRYCQTVRMTNTAGSLATQRFRANGMYDPDQTGIGHQPLYFDQLSALYNNWTVIGSKISVTVVHTGSGVPTEVFLVLDDDASSSSVVTTLKEQTLNKTRVISYGNSAPKTFTTTYSAKKQYRGGVLSNNRLQGDSANDPTEQSYFTVITSPVDGITNNNVDIIVKIEYIAIWTNMKEISGS